LLFEPLLNLLAVDGAIGLEAADGVPTLLMNTVNWMKPI
jgi:hypothetical protein